MEVNTRSVDFHDLLKARVLDIAPPLQLIRFDGISDATHPRGGWSRGQGRSQGFGGQRLIQGGHRMISTRCNVLAQRRRRKEDDET